MTRVALVNKDNGAEPVLYMAMELSNKQWKLVFGDAVKRRHVSVEAGHRVALREAIQQAKERFRLPPETPGTKPVFTSSDDGGESSRTHIRSGSCSRFSSSLSDLA